MRASRQRSARWTLALAAASASAAAACSLHVDTGGYAGGGADGGSLEGAKDASSDGGTLPDGGSPSDAAPDAPFCQLNADAALCIDFDEGASAGSYFSGSKVDPRVTSVITDGPFSTRSLALDFPGATLTNGYIEHWGERQLLVTAQKSVSASVRLQIDRTDSTHYVRSFELVVGKNGGYVSFFVQSTTTQSLFYSQVYAADGGALSTNTADVVRAIPMGTPVRLEFQRDATQNPGKAVVLVDGQVASLPLTFDPQLVIGGAPDVAVHLTSYDKAGDSLAATTFHFDDLLMNVE